MSWHIKVAGPKKDVKALIQANTQLPDTVKSLLLVQVDAVSDKVLAQWSGDKYKTGVIVESNGHLDPEMGGNLEIKVSPILIGMADTQPVPAA
jgi:hypothetical protein